MELGLEVLGSCRELSALGFVGSMLAADGSDGEDSRPVRVAAYGTNGAALTPSDFRC